LRLAEEIWNGLVRFLPLLQVEKKDEET